MPIELKEATACVRALVALAKADGTILTPRIGVTIGAETGAEAKAGKPGPRSSVFGAGLSYAFK